MWILLRLIQTMEKVLIDFFRGKKIGGIQKENSVEKKSF